MPSSPGPVGSTRMAFRMTIGLPRPWPGYPHHTGLISASCTSNPRFRHRLSSDPALRRTPLPRRMVPVITVHRGLPPPECTSLLDTPGETACPTLLAGSIVCEVGGAGGFACLPNLIPAAHQNRRTCKHCQLYQESNRSTGKAASERSIASSIRTSEGG